MILYLVMQNLHHIVDKSKYDSLIMFKRRSHYVKNALELVGH